MKVFLCRLTLVVDSLLLLGLRFLSFFLIDQFVHCHHWLLSIPMLRILLLILAFVLLWSHWLAGIIVVVLGCFVPNRYLIILWLMLGLHGGWLDRLGILRASTTMLIIVVILIEGLGTCDRIVILEVILSACKLYIFLDVELRTAFFCKLIGIGIFDGFCGIWWVVGAVHAFVVSLIVVFDLLLLCLFILIYCETS